MMIDNIAQRVDAIRATHNTNTGHGHVWPRPDGVRMRCGGPGMCNECSADAARAQPLTLQEITTLLDAYNDARRQVNTLRSALSPFAKCGAKWSKGDALDYKNDEALPPHAFTLTVGHVRKSSIAYNATQPPKVKK